MYFHIMNNKHTFDVCNGYNSVMKFHTKTLWNPEMLDLYKKEHQHYLVNDY